MKFLRTWAHQIRKQLSYRNKKSQLTRIHQQVLQRPSLLCISNMAADCESPCKWVAVCQMTAKNSKLYNLEICRNMIRDASSKGAKMIFLPECFDFVGENKEQSVAMAEPLSGATITEYKKLAKELKTWLSLGGFHEKGPPDNPNRIFNSHLVIDDHGEIKAVYRKTHLFNVDIKDGVTLKETEHTIPGKEILPPIDTPVDHPAGNNMELKTTGHIEHLQSGDQTMAREDSAWQAMPQCYDLRFPEESIVQTQLGAQILTFPSAFTVVTGMAHWEVLLRARAIENQCYVIAAAQTGEHNEKRRSYGHSMDGASAVIRSLQASVVIKLCQTPGNGLSQALHQGTLMGDSR